jgi:putative ABC transport system ATP-binding protein
MTADDRPKESIKPFSVLAGDCLLTTDDRFKEGATQVPLSGTSPQGGREEEAPRALHVEGATQVPLIAFKGVTKVYGMGNATVAALRGIDLCIDEGEFVAIMGPSGSGKSTCMNILGCLDTPTGGTYTFRDVDVGMLTRNQRALLRRHYQGFIFQGYNLLSRTSALENVELPLLYRGAGVHDRRERAMEALETVGLKGWESHTPGELSGGQQQRVAIARAIVTNPAVLLADEPTGNLDTARSREIMDVLTGLNRDGGITIVMITHEQDMAVYAKRQIHFRDGLVVSDEQNGGAG